MCFKNLVNISYKGHSQSVQKFLANLNAYFEKAIRSLCHFTNMQLKQLKTFPKRLCKTTADPSCCSSGVDWKVPADYSTWRKHIVNIL